MFFFSLKTTMPVSINQISVQQIPEILSFIEPHEAECVNLVHEILRGAENCYVVQSGGAVCGAFCFRARRTIFHCLPFTKYKTQQDKILCQETQAAFYEFFANEKPFCINGESTGSLFLKNILKNKPAPIMAKVTNDYWLMSVSRGSEQLQEAASSSNSSCQEFDACSKPNIFRATADDAEKLFPLEKAYQYEEVIPPSFSVSDETLREALKLNLRNQKIFAYQATAAGSRQQRVVAKAALTAEGKNFALLGGVYTLPEHRRRGYARILVQHILQEVGAPTANNNSCEAAASTPCALGTPARPMNAALYVKKNNAAAIALYKSLGFEQAGEYKIIYL